jgi:protoporphyrinogen oxidase
LERTAIVIGGGPAGLTAAYELLDRTDIKPIVIEQSEYMGGISRTVDYKGNKIDIGGHRFFTKSDRVMNWWLKMLPTEETVDPALDDLVMLIRHRKSRILFAKHFFDYPISLSYQTLMQLGLWRTVKILLSFLRTRLFPIKDEKNLADFFTNRFGRELYLTFFKSYTEKVWGIPCEEISAEWGDQRVKGLSIWTAIRHVLKSIFGTKADIAQKDIETSLIERFLYPKYGPGQMWEQVAKLIEERGGQVIKGLEVDRILVKDGCVTVVQASGTGDGGTRTFEGDFFISTMPVRDLVNAIGDEVPTGVREVSEALQYRDFIAVGVLLKKLRLSGNGEDGAQLIKDNWIYIQEPDVTVGRMQILNNWSPFLVADPSKVWISLEYFCSEQDELWQKPPEEMARFAISELRQLGFIEDGDVLDWTVIHMPKTYPVYSGAYARFDEVREYLDGIRNLYLVGRNGMHKYNNMDHSMLTAMVAVDSIIGGVTDRSNIWAVNTEQEYIEGEQ